MTGKERLKKLLDEYVPASIYRARIRAAMQKLADENTLALYAEIDTLKATIQDMQTEINDLRTALHESEAA